MNRRTLILIAGAVIVVLGLWLWLRPHHATTAKGPPAVPVDVGTAEARDVPVYAEGLGTVQAFYTVQVTARVDGEVDKIGFTEGQDVRKGALLAQIDPRPFQAALGVAMATRDKDKAQLANAQLDMQRYQLLAPEDLASKQTVDTQKALIAQLGAQIKGDEAAIDNARTQLDYTTIRSPIDGRTGIRLVDPGNIVRAASATGIVVVTQIEPITVIFSLPEEQFREVSDALHRGAVEAVALTRDRSTELDRGTLELIDNQIDQTTGTLRLKAVMPNKQRHLWPGQFVTMEVLTSIQHQALTIPSEALERGPDGLYAYLIGPDSRVTVAPITAGVTDKGRVVVQKGLKAGDRVVTSNQYRVQPGSLIKPNAPHAEAPKVAANGAPEGAP
jgi:membrane fusion protein, multidrug efflux system